jgi:ribosomal protein S18 acetylase RimI-like enzyme
MVDDRRTKRLKGPSWPGQAKNPGPGTQDPSRGGAPSTAVARIAPGPPLPAWLTELDAATFGEAWGPLARHEGLWVIEGAAFARWSLVPIAHEGELLRIAVDPARRGQGLGRELLEGVQRELRAGGFTELHLEVRVGNAAARALYAACGWREVGHRAKYYGDGEDAVLCAWTAPKR